MQDGEAEEEDGEAEEEYPIVLALFSNEEYRQCYGYDEDGLFRKEKQTYTFGHCINLIAPWNLLAEKIYITSTLASELFEAEALFELSIPNGNMTHLKTIMVSFSKPENLSDKYVHPTFKQSPEFLMYERDLSAEIKTGNEHRAFKASEIKLTMKKLPNRDPDGPQIDPTKPFGRYHKVRDKAEQYFTEKKHFVTECAEKFNCYDSPTTNDVERVKKFYKRCSLIYHPDKARKATARQVSSHGDREKAQSILDDQATENFKLLRQCYDTHLELIKNKVL